MGASDFLGIAEEEMKTFTSADFAVWGRRGGQKSRRKLTKQQARDMVAAREAKRARNEAAKDFR